MSMDRVRVENQGSNLAVVRHKEYLSEGERLSGYGDDDTEEVVTWPAQGMIAMVEDSRIAHVSVEWVLSPCHAFAAFRIGRETRSALTPAEEPRSYP
jgi:hypothetical protein